MISRTGAWGFQSPALGRVAITLALVAVAVGLQVVAIGGLVVGRIEPLVILAIVVLSALSLWRWRWGVLLVLVYVTVEGFVTNLLYPSITPLFFKDAMVVAVCLGYFASAASGRAPWLVPRSVLWPLAVLVLLAAVQSLNPRSGGILVALVGMRVLLLYIPLYAVGSALAADRRALDKLARLVLVGSIPITAYGIYQYFAGPEAAASLGEGFARTIWIIGAEATSDSIYRPASTFTFIGHFGSYLLVVGILAYAALHQRPSPVALPLAAALFIVTAVAVVLQSQRTTWVLLPVAALGMYVLNRDLRGTFRALPVIVIGLVVAANLGEGVLANRLPFLTSGLDPYAQRAFDTTGGRLERSFFTEDALVGHGTGAALGATRYVTGAVPVAFESGWFIPFYMFGVWGLLVYGWTYLAVFRAAWTGADTFPAGQRWLPISALMFMLLTGGLGGPVVYPPANVYFWLFAGMLGGLARAPASTAARPAGASRPNRERDG